MESVNPDSLHCVAGDSSGIKSAAEPNHIDNLSCLCEVFVLRRKPWIFGMDTQV